VCTCILGTKYMYIVHEIYVLKCIFFGCYYASSTRGHNSIGHLAFNFKCHVLSMSLFDVSASMEECNIVVANIFYTEEMEAKATMSPF
jgi:hypothetical protein